MRTAVAAAIVCACLVELHGGRAGAADTPLPIYPLITGEESVHAVADGETLGHVALRFGMKMQLVATMNQLPDVNRLRLGQRLRVSNRHIVPVKLPSGVVINVADRTLYWLRDGALVASFPVGVGRQEWETPPGHYTITGRRRDPVWHVPPSIQREMRQQGQPVKKKVPPGPDNPLGKYWLQLSAGGYGIHGTNAPWSVGKYTTHGCIRLRPDDIERLYKELPTGTEVEVIDEPVKMARSESDTILLEAHPAVSNHGRKILADCLNQLEASDLAELVDLAAARRVLQDTWGVAVDVSKKKHVEADPTDVATQQ